VRTLNSLKNNGLRSLRDLAGSTAEDLDKVRNVGGKAVREIADLLHKQGLNFGMTFEDADGEIRIVNEGQTPESVLAALQEGEGE
jgi:DNA-directed RNA polymerase subunit alpha